MNDPNLIIEALKAIDMGNAIQTVLFSIMWFVSFISWVLLHE